MEQQDDYLTPNPYEELQQSQENLIKQDPKQNELNRLCFEVFIANPAGQQLYELMRDRFLLQINFDPTKPNPEQTAIYNEGCRGVVIGLMELAKIHQQQIMEMTKDEQPK